jgi:hypothetical protein
MLDKPTSSPGELPNYSDHEIEAEPGLIDQYADIFNDYTNYAQAVRRFVELPSVIETVNNQLDRSTSAFYAETLNSTVYQFSADEQTWQKLADYTITGPLRPFIGDRLVIIDDDVLLLVDTAREIAVSHFTNLQIRPKEDLVVEEFSSAESVSTLNDLGEAARDAHQIGLIQRGKWGQEETRPSLD